MFDLSLVDTLRLAFAQAVYHHKAHARAASMLARCSRWFRTAETILLMGVVISTLAAAFTAGGTGHAYAVTSAVLASLALLIFIIHATFDFESTARAHHVCSTRLWSIREQYRALLADLHDSAVESDVARARRNILMEEVAAMHDRAPALTRRLFKVSPGSADGAEELALSDEEIDRFLPKSLRGSSRPAPASA
jgi:SMODS and SLOG-associating 2TM effector domain family 4